MTRPIRLVFTVKSAVCVCDSNEYRLRQVAGLNNTLIQIAVSPTNACANYIQIRPVRKRRRQGLIKGFILAAIILSHFCPPLCFALIFFLSAYSTRKATVSSARLCQVAI